MLPKKRRVPLSRFPRTAKTIARSEYFIVKSAENGTDSSRMGVIVPRGAGTAAHRNFLKRMFFETERLFREVGKDTVFIVSPRMRTLPRRNVRGVISAGIRDRASK